eukprot:GILK01001553.1.p1 GENE.GILK01001553.1~~GILK01001553.1.p1  ORF type:complete len:573 (-),score=64.61 GILK01001553.1:310-1941(-)
MATTLPKIGMTSQNSTSLRTSRQHSTPALLPKLSEGNNLTVSALVSPQSVRYAENSFLSSPTKVRYARCMSFTKSYLGMQYHDTGLYAASRAKVLQEKLEGVRPLTPNTERMKRRKKYDSHLKLKQNEDRVQLQTRQLKRRETISLRMLQDKQRELVMNLARQQNEAAARIQHEFRFRKAQRARREREWKERHNALKIQSAFRGYKVRKAYPNLKMDWHREKEQKAALVIQRGFRTHKRRQQIKLRNGIHGFAYNLQYFETLKKNLQNESARDIQQKWKDFRFRKRTRAVRVVQKHYRARIAARGGVGVLAQIEAERELARLKKRRYGGVSSSKAVDTATSKSPTPLPTAARRSPDVKTMISSSSQTHVVPLTREHLEDKGRTRANSVSMVSSSQNSVRSVSTHDLERSLLTSQSTPTLPPVSPPSPTIPAATTANHHPAKRATNATTQLPRKSLEGVAAFNAALSPDKRHVSTANSNSNSNRRNTQRKDHNKKQQQQNRRGRSKSRYHHHHHYHYHQQQQQKRCRAVALLPTAWTCWAAGPR